MKEMIENIILNYMCMFISVIFIECFTSESNLTKIYEYTCASALLEQILTQKYNFDCAKFEPYMVSLLQFGRLKNDFQYIMLFILCMCSLVSFDMTVTYETFTRLIKQFLLLYVLSIIIKVVIVILLSGKNHDS